MYWSLVYLAGLRHYARTPLLYGCPSLPFTVPFFVLFTMGVPSNGPFGENTGGQYEGCIVDTGNVIFKYRIAEPPCWWCYYIADRVCATVASWVGFARITHYWGPSGGRHF